MQKSSARTLLVKTVLIRSRRGRTDCGRSLARVLPFLPCRIGARVPRFAT